MSAAQGDPEAIAIHQRLVEGVRQALLKGDFDLFLSCFRLPNIVSTWENTCAFETARDLHRVYDGLRANLSALKVERFERISVLARFIDHRKIEAVHETKLFNKDGLALPPAVVHSILENFDGRWLTTVSRYEVAASPILQRTLSSGRALTPDEAARLGLGD